jgi:hypothetical protein
MRAVCATCRPTLCATAHSCSTRRSWWCTKAAFMVGCSLSLSLSLSLCSLFFLLFALFSWLPPFSPFLFLYSLPFLFSFKTASISICHLVFFFVLLVFFPFALTSSCSTLWISLFRLVIFPLLSIAIFDCTLTHARTRTCTHARMHAHASQPASCFVPCERFCNSFQEPHTSAFGGPSLSLVCFCSILPFFQDQLAGSSFYS